MKVLVYGTLKYGMGMGLETWCEECHLLEKGVVVQGYGLYTGAGYPKPKVKPNQHLIAELWSVPDTILPDLDSYEGYPCLFDRVLVELPGCSAWMYVYNGEVRDEDLLVLGEWDTRVV